MKKCIKCSVEKPLTEYDLDRAKPDSRRNTCRDCRKWGTRLTSGGMSQYAAANNLGAVLGMRVSIKKGSRREKYWSRNSRPVIGTCLETGKEVRFKSIGETGYAGFHPGNVSKVVQGKYASSGNHTWRYDERNVCS